MQEEYEQGGDISKFNPAQHKMNRINDISRTINEAKLSLFSWNPTWNSWNYIVWFVGLTILYGEVFIKFSEDEKKECEKIRKAINDCLLKYPIQEQLKNGRWSRVNMERFEIFKKFIGIYEDKVKEMQDAHGLDTPNREDDQGL